MRYIFDENTSHHVTHLMRQLGADVCHETEEFGAGAKDPDFLPEIARRGWVLVTTDLKMNSFRGRDGHRAILLENKNKVLFLPTQFIKWGAWQKASWTLSHWERIVKQAETLKNFTLARITDNGKVVSID